MFKKMMIALLVALVVGVGILGVVSTTYAQDDDVPPEAITELEQATIEAENVEPNTELKEASYEYQYDFQYGEGNGDYDSVRTQTRTQTQLRDLQDGECTGAGEPQQLRINQGAGNQGLRRQEQKSLQDGSCNGDCVQPNQGGQGQ